MLMRVVLFILFFFFSSRRRHTRSTRDWSSDVCSSDLRLESFSTGERLQALTYLGATELFRDRRDSALAAFRQIAVTDPKYRPSEIIFPPQVTGVLQEVRPQTKTVFLQVPPVTALRAKVEHFTAR